MASTETIIYSYLVSQGFSAAAKAFLAESACSKDTPFNAEQLIASFKRQTAKLPASAPAPQQKAMKDSSSSSSSSDDSSSDDSSSDDEKPATKAVAAAPTKKASNYERFFFLFFII
eukprot:UN10070